MRKVLLMTGELYPIVSGAGLHTYGYCSMISKYCEFYACSLYFETDGVTAETTVEKDFRVKLIQPYSNLLEKLQNAPQILKANFLFMYPIYDRMYKEIVRIVQEREIDTVIIDHVTMGLYYYKLKKKFPQIRYIYNSHNVEYVNIYDRHIKFLKGWSFRNLRKQLNLIRYHFFRRIEKDLLENTFAVFDISETDIEMLKKEYHLTQNKMYLAKPLSEFKPIKRLESVRSFHKKLLIVGSMGWYPNVNGIIWFVENVFSKLIQIDSEYKLYLVGRGAGEDIKRFVTQYPDNILLVGAVPYTDPYFEECDLSIVPVFEGTGAKLKVLESLARHIPTVCSGFAAKDYGLQKEAAICDTSEEFIDAILQLEKDVSYRERLVNFMVAYMSEYYQLNPKIIEVLR